MKALIFVLASLFFQIGVSVPHRHRKAHSKRALVTDIFTVIDIVTVTDPNAVVWVDEDGNVVSTQYYDSTTSTLAATVSLDNTMNTAAGYNAPSTTSSSSPSPPASTTPASSTPASTSVPQTSSSPSSVSSSSVPVPTSSQSSSNTGLIANGFGVCYEIIDATGNCKSVSTIDSDLAFLSSKGFKLIRIYDIGCDVGGLVAAAGNHGLKVFAGINNALNVNTDLPKLVSMINGNWGPIDTINIGNENVNSGTASAAQVVNAINQAKGILSAAGYSGNIVTVDTFNQHVSNPQLCQASSYCAANAHAYFDTNTNANTAGTFVLNAQAQVQAANQGKRVVITESGWPYAGSPNGAAVPTVQNQRIAIANIMQAFTTQASDLFLFQAWDATYKQPGPLGVEQYFGLFDSDHFNGYL